MVKFLVRTLTITLFISMTSVSPSNAVRLHDPNPITMAMNNCYNKNILSYAKKFDKNLAPNFEKIGLYGSDKLISNYGGYSCFFTSSGSDTGVRASYLPGGNKYFNNYKKTLLAEKYKSFKTKDGVVIYYKNEINLTGEGHTYSIEFYTKGCWISYKSTFNYEKIPSLKLIEVLKKDCLTRI